MDKQYAFAVILIILGVGLSQSGTTDAFYSGLGIGIVGLGIFWVIIRLIKELKR
jgi:galactitol-specific phosphotransferase system IIC component|tara:strand:- start:2030 stop:2191 length:162 start_codon:yes stop_codon:yes gene_type:complete